MIDLKTCPFCGGKAVFNTTAYSSSNHCAGITFEIKCCDCGIHSREQEQVSFDLQNDGVIAIKHDGREELAIKWNTRHKEDPDNGQVD